MKRTLISTTLALVFIFGAFSSDALAQRHNRVCQMRYNAELRSARHLRGPARRIRMREARREYNECMRRGRRY